MSNLDVMETWFRRVWKDADASAIDDMMTEKMPVEGLGGPTVVGPAEFKEFHKHLLGLIDEVDITVDRSIESGNTIAALCTVRAKDRQSGKPVSVTGQTLVEIENGKLSVGYNHWDFMGLYQQLGLLPAESFQRCLAGERVGGT